MKKTRGIVVAAFLAAVLAASKYALDGLPNIELVSLLIILYTLEFPSLVFPAVYTYLLVYGLLNGFGLWWWALLSGIFGLCYGALYAVAHAFVAGPAGGVAYWVAGIPFDFVHGAGNFAAALVLFSPLRRCLQRVKRAALPHAL